MRLVINIAEGGGSWDLAEDVVKFVEDLLRDDGEVRVEVDRSRVHDEEPEIVVDVEEVA